MEPLKSSHYLCGSESKLFGLGATERAVNLFYVLKRSAVIGYSHTTPGRQRRHSFNLQAYRFSYLRML
jgi:hypothetical protein